MGVLSPSSGQFKTRPFSGKIYFTYDDLLSLPEWPSGPMLELIKGELYLVHSPPLIHQDITRNMLIAFERYLTLNELGVVYNAPVDVKLSEEDVVIPDLVVVLKERQHILEEHSITGTPDLIVEIMSSNKQRDMGEKYDLYEQFGVTEYWTIIPEEKSTWVFTLGDDRRFGSGQRYSFEEKIESIVLRGFRTTLKELFKR